MGLFDWIRKPALPDPIYSVMNEDHVHLYRILGELRQGVGKRSDDHAARERKRAHCLTIVDRLIADADAHFLREEGLMERYGYPATRAHRTEHLKLQRSIQLYRAKLAAGTLPVDEDVSQYLKGWLTGHIRTTDRQLERFLFDAHKLRDLHGQMALSSRDMAVFNAMVASGRSEPAGKAGRR